MSALASSWWLLFLSGSILSLLLVPGVALDISSASGQASVGQAASSASGEPLAAATPTRPSGQPLTVVATPTGTATATAISTPTPTPGYLPRAPKPDGEPADLVVHGSESTGCAALTFDVAISDSAFTSSILDTLAEARVHSTFFLTGQWVENNQDLAARIAQDGHEIANHSYDHPHFNSMSAEEILWQVEYTDELMRAATGIEPAPYFRPPFGEYDDRVLRVLGQDGYYVIYWSLDSTDWQPSSTESSVISRVVSRTGPGDIVVFHGYVDKTARALPAIIEQLRGQGLCLDTLSTLLR